MPNAFRTVSVGVALVAALTAMQGAAEPAPAPHNGATAVIACDSHGLPVGFSLICALVVRDARGILAHGPPPTAWSSSNERLATVSPNGLVRSVAGAGSVNIAATAMVNGQAVAANRVVTIGPNAKASRLTPTVMAPAPSQIRVGERVLLDCAATDDAGKSPQVFATVWKTASQEIAAVSSLGVVTAVAPGTAAITCSSYPASAAITITVVR